MKKIICFLYILKWCGYFGWTVSESNNETTSNVYNCLIFKNVTTILKIFQKEEICFSAQQPSVLVAVPAPRTHYWDKEHLGVLPWATTKGQKWPFTGHWFYATAKKEKNITMCKREGGRNSFNLKVYKAWQKIWQFYIKNELKWQINTKAHASRQNNILHKNLIRLLLSYGMDICYRNLF